MNAEMFNGVHIQKCSSPTENNQFTNKPFMDSIKLLLNYYSMRALFKRCEYLVNIRLNQQKYKNKVKN